MQTKIAGRVIDIFFLNGETGTLSMLRMKAGV